MTTVPSRAARQADLSLSQARVRRIVDSVAEGQQYHLKVVFADGSVHHTSRLGDPL